MGTNYCSFAYSALASFRMGMSGSASFQRVKKSRYAVWAFAESPCIAYARARPSRASAPSGKVSHRAPVIDEFLIFRRCFFASMQPQIGFASYIGGIEGCSPFGREQYGSEFVRGRPLEKLDGFGRVVVIKFDGSANGGKPIPLISVSSG